MITKIQEALANNKKLATGVIFGSIIVQGICTVVTITASYFAGVNTGVGVTEVEEDEDE